MEQNRIRLMEKLDRCFVEHLRRSAEVGGGYPADLVEVYHGHLHGRGESGGRGYHLGRRLHQLYERMGACPKKQAK